MTVVDALLGDYDASLDEISNCVFHDNGVEVKVSAIDQLLLALTCRLLTDRLLGHVGIVQIPRYKNRNALLVSICSQLLCRRDPALLRGPVVFVGFDVAVADQLRSLAVHNHRRIGLADGNPLSMHRITRAGLLEPVVGVHRGSVNGSLIYFNTRIGDPPLDSAAPLVIVDGTVVLSRSARERVLRWVTEHQAAAVVVISDIGDNDIIGTCETVGMVPTVLAVTQDELAQLAYEFGRHDPSTSPLSSMRLLWSMPTCVRIRQVRSVLIDEALARAYGTLGAKPDGPVPPELEMPLKLLRNGTRLAARVRDYRTACTHNIRPGELPLLRRLEGMTFVGPPSWRSWGSTRFGTLKVAIRNIWEMLEQENPKLLALWGALDQLHRTDSDCRILIRCHSRAAAEATRASLCTGERTEEQLGLWAAINGRISFATFSDRYAAGSFDAQVLTGAPPPWLLSLLFGVEATETHVLTYAAEESMLRSQLQRIVANLNAWRVAAARTLTASPPAALASPVAPPEGTTPAAVVAALRVPQLDLADVLDRAAQGIDARDIENVVTTRIFSVGQKDCIPVVLEDGRTWWCIDDGARATPVLTVTAGGHETRPVSDLRPGDRIVVPAGEGTESVHARLVAASRSNDDVRALDLILEQFRAAARAVRGDGTRRQAVERVRRAGAHAAGQLQDWERGTTIAPREPCDVEAVFKAAGRPCPDLGLVYAVAGKLRSLNIILGRFVAAMAAGRGEEAVHKLRELVGATADEILDEFVVVTVREVKEKRSVSGAVAGKLR
ncbi:MAG: hypothetical protein ACRD07_04545 [Acidimicrobiales bacterium]